MRIALCYHRISEHPSGGESKLVVSPGLFVSQIKFLKRISRNVTLDHLVSGGKGFALTFDDGYADNLHVVVPILENLSLTGTFFISTKFVENGLCYLPDVLDIAFSSGEGERVRNLLRDLIPSEQNSEIDYWQAHEIIRNLEPNKFWGALQNLNSYFGKDVIKSDPLRRPLSSSELAILSESPRVSIGAHGSSHVRMSSQNISDVQSEVIESYAYLLASGISPVRYFAYPFGQRNDFNEGTNAILANYGLAGLSTLPQGIRKTSPDGCIPRLCVQDWGPPKLFAIILACGLGARFPALWSSALKFRRQLLRALRYSRR